MDNETRLEDEDKTRDRILEAADACIRQLGVRQMTVQDILDAAGVSRSTFYRRFRDIDDILVSLAVRRWTSRLPVITAVLSDVRTDAPARWLKFIAAVVLSSGEKSKDPLYTEESNLHITRLFYGMDTEKRDQVVATLVPFIAAAQARKELRNDVPPHRIAEWLLRQMWALSSLPMKGEWDAEGLDDYISTFVLPSVLYPHPGGRQDGLIEQIRGQLQKLDAIVEAWQSDSQNDRGRRRGRK